MSWTLWLQFALCPVVLLTLLRIPAPYGRHGRPGWGPSLPQRSAWFWMELPALGVITVLVLSHPSGRSPNAWIPLTLLAVVLYFSSRDEKSKRSQDDTAGGVLGCGRFVARCPGC